MTLVCKHEARVYWYVGEIVITLKWGHKAGPQYNR